MGDPQHRVTRIDDRRGVGHAILPAVRAGVDDRGDAGALRHPGEPLQHPVGQLGRREVARTLEVEHGQDVARRQLRGVDEMVGLRDRVERMQVRTGEVIGAERDAGGHGFRAVRREQGIDVAGAFGRFRDGEPDARSRDLRPIDRVLMVADVDAGQAVRRRGRYLARLDVMVRSLTGRRPCGWRRRHRPPDESERREDARGRAGRPSQCRGFSPVARASHISVT